MAKKGTSTFKYTNPEAFYDEEKNKYFILTFGGKKKYFDSEAEYDRYVKHDREKAYRKFLSDSKEVRAMAKRVHGDFSRGEIFGRRRSR